MRVCHSAVYTRMLIWLYARNVNVFVYVLAVLSRACPGFCLSDCLFRPPTLPPPPSLPLSLTLALFLQFSITLSLSLILTRSLARSPSSSLCNNSADLVSACSGLPVEFYSRLPSWLLCCSKTQAEKHDCGFFFLPFSHRYSFIYSPFFCILKQVIPF